MKTSSFNITNPDDDDIATAMFFRQLFTSSQRGGGAFGARYYNTKKGVDWLLGRHKSVRTRFCANEADSLSIIADVKFKGVKLTVLMERDCRSRPYTFVKVISPSYSALNSYLSWLDRIIPLRPAPKEVEEAVTVDFLYQGAMGRASTVSRSIEAPTWEDIKHNYSKPAAESLEALIGVKLDELNGKFGVLHGPAGTGKTSYLRALMQAWRKQAKFTYVMDAEDFFRDPKYMVQVIFENLTHTAGHWNVILCEDAEEFIAPDAKKDVGQALSRLLNLGDGLLGQGLQLLFLFTTNAKLEALHPAMVRKGRCFSNIEVPALTAAEATEWLKEPISTEMVLADLYAMKRNDK